MTTTEKNKLCRHKRTNSPYHKHCTEPWIPPSGSGPGRKRHHSSAAAAAASAKPPAAPKTNYPLCLVCDRDYGGFFESDCGWVEDPNSQKYLDRKFQKTTNR